MPVLAGSRSCWKGEMLEIRMVREMLMERVVERLSKRCDGVRWAGYPAIVGIVVRTAAEVASIAVKTRYVSVIVVLQIRNVVYRRMV